MIFKIFSANLLNSFDILREYPCLRNFKIDERQESDWLQLIVEIDTSEELVKMQQELDQELIINGDCITIYDDYIE